MRLHTRDIAAASVLLLCVTPGLAAGARPLRPELAFQMTEGQNLNAFVRDGQVAAHLLLRNGTDPRILVAFPGGNSGVGLWFAPLEHPATWHLEQPPAPLSLTDSKGRSLHGIQAIASLSTPRLSIRQAVLSSVRFLRDYQAVGTFPAEVAAPLQVDGTRMLYTRDRVDGAPGYRLELEVLQGHLSGSTIVADTNGRIRLKIIAASGDTPLTGLTEANLLNARAAHDPGARNALKFLSYREKFLAGSWRFNTYFGRDTLMSVRLLMPVLRAPAIEAGIGAVLARLNPTGEVAHEEGLSEFAVIDNRQNAQAGSDSATLDYGMIDDDYMLGPVAADYLLDHASPAAAGAFLARPVPSLARPGDAETAGALLTRNLRFVIAQAAPFASQPVPARLLAIKAGRCANDLQPIDGNV